VKVCDVPRFPVAAVKLSANAGKEQAIPVAARASNLSLNLNLLRMYFSCGFGWYQAGTFAVYSARKRHQIGQIPYENPRKYGGGVSQVVINWFLLTATKDWHGLPDLGYRFSRGPKTEASASRTGYRKEFPS
jgi:hypothetical protein